MKNTTPPRWYLRIDGSVYGPYSRLNILEFSSQGRVPASATVRRKGERCWVPAAQIVGVDSVPESPRVGLQVGVMLSTFKVKRRLQIALGIISASPFVGVFAGPVIGLGVFESYMFGPLCGFVLAGSICRGMILAGNSQTRGSQRA